MKRNVMLMTAVALALGSMGAGAAQDAEQCAQDALQLKMQIEQSNLADPDRAKLESSLSEAQGADLARCEQIVARVKREVGASADATTKDDYAAASRNAANAASAAAGTTDASPSSEMGVPSTTRDSMSGSDSTATTAGTSAKSGTSPSSSADSYEPGHATAEETLPGEPGADANSAEASNTTMQNEGYASAQETMPPSGSSATGTETPTGDAASTTMHPIDEAAKPNPSTAQIASMTTDELVDKPVKNANGDEVGEIGAIVVDREATPHAYAVVEYGGMFGIGEKQVLVDLEQLQLTADGSISVPATDEDAFSAYPKYEEDLYQTYQGDLGQLL